MSNPNTGYAPYSPSQLIAKVTHVPELLKNHPELENLFKKMIEDLAVDISDTHMSTSLQTYSVPETSATGKDLSFYALPDPEIKTINVTIGEIKDKRISRTLKEICKICFKEKSVPAAGVISENVGFDLLIYELDTQGVEVIDAWKLVNFTIPYGLDIALSKTDCVPGKAKEEKMYDMPLEGMFISNDFVIREAAAFHRFNSESKV